MKTGTCKLCKAETELLNSHIVPAFAFRWLKASSGHGKIRKGSNPNQRIQDGDKRFWLCSDCEDLLNISETLFSNELFYPYTESSGEKFYYNSWLLHFCTSLSWRVLVWYLEDNHLKNWSENELLIVHKAEETWRNFLLSNLPHPGSYRQYLIPLDEIKNTNAPTVPSFNRYLMRAIDTDICKSENTKFVYSKIGRFIFVGTIEPHKRNIWQGAKINANKGVIEPRKYVLHRSFWEYILEKAQRASDLLGSVSEKQQEKIDYSFKKNIDNYIDSDAFKAMKADVDSFGDEAFTKK